MTEKRQSAEHNWVGRQVDEHRYSVWVPGNCASVRLAKLLASDTVVMKLVSPEIEWYYPLLQPGRHYLPVWVKGNDTGLPEAVAWARSHPTAVSTSPPPALPPRHPETALLPFAAAGGS